MRLITIAALLTSAAQYIHARTPGGNAFSDEPASAEDFQKYAAKGGALMCGLHATDETAGRLIKDTREPPSAASVWIGDLKQELHTWYWRERPTPYYNCDLNDHWNFHNALKGLGLYGETSPVGNTKCIRVEHWDPNMQVDGKQVPSILQWYKVDGKAYQATEAHFEFGVNTLGGAISGFYLLGPKVAASGLWYQSHKDPALELLPRLRALSDVLWGYWNRDNADIKNIRYFFMVGIANDETNELIASCLQSRKKESLEPWPGLQFSTSTDEGRALLGSPNGAVFAYFLMQHKAQLGYKTITKVTIIRPEDDEDPEFVDATLIFHVENAPEPPADDKDKPHLVLSGLMDIVRGSDTRNWLRVHRVL